VASSVSDLSVTSKDSKDSGDSRDSAGGLAVTTATALKVAVVGPVGVGKTTLVTSVSEIRPLTTEESMSAGRDNVTGPAHKDTTTVAMDFGRISLSESLVLYLFGTPGQDRFWFLWDGLVTGALGAVVLVDVRRLAESFDVLERLEKRSVAFIVAANQFPGAPVHPVPDLRAALDLPESVPIMYFDARDRASCREVLLTMARYLLSLAESPAA
jgi:signal recognition particle receptor subunit beta